MLHFSNQQNPQENWLYNKADSVQKEAERIARINDEGTSADEILRWSRWALYALLVYSGLLGAMSYFKNFEPSFGYYPAVIMSLVLAGVIELGKNFFSKWTLRIPFFRGRAGIFAAPHNTFLWVGALAFSVATFWMSVRNSTKGGEQLALMLRHEREDTKFTPDTKALDEQIASTQANITANNGVKYKGTQTYQAQKSNVVLSSTLSDLTKQRDAAIAQQRADWETEQKTKGDNASFAASLVMASGGWVELLQVIVILLIVSSERTLLKRAQAMAAEALRTDGNSPTYNGSNNNNFRVNNNGVTYNQPGNNFHNSHRQQPIGFRYSSTPPPPLTESDRGLTEFNVIGSNAASLDAFKQHRSDFYRYRSNLQRGVGNRDTVCGHIKTALEKMYFHLSAVPDKMKYETLQELIAFGEVDQMIFKEYAVPHEKTPLGIYHGAFYTIYTALKDVPQPV